ncbi:hypothetical protein EBR43_05460 [bacterium]|nr:hypothetical protein [bacterium]
MLTSFVAVSGNRKTGPIPTTMTERESCPTTCPFYDKGCYAKTGLTAIHWRKVVKNGLEWNDFLKKVKSISHNQLWRHNVSGDLPHNDGIINAEKVSELVNANRGRRGFTYTHHKLNKANLEVIKSSNNNGFTINASTESVEVADSIMTEHKIPAVAVINSNCDKRFFKTSSGRKVVVCPATIHENVNCSTCGLCQQSNREFIIAFPAHGVAKKTVNQIVS